MRRIEASSNYSVTIVCNEDSREACLERWEKKKVFEQSELSVVISSVGPDVRATTMVIQHGPSTLSKHLFTLPK